MVSTRKVHEAQRPPFEQWLASLDMSEETRQKLREISHMPEQLLVGQEMVEILHQLNMDDATLQAALVFPYCQQHMLTDAEVKDTFGDEIEQGLKLGFRFPRESGDKGAADGQVGTNGAPRADAVRARSSKL